MVVRHVYATRHIRFEVSHLHHHICLLGSTWAIPKCDLLIQTSGHLGVGFNDPKSPIDN